MATCKECIHYEVCKTEKGSTVFYREGLLSSTYDQVDKICGALFRDRSRFVELIISEWVEDEDMYGEPIYRCSNCSERFVLEEGTPIDNCYFYCPNCGAKMDNKR